MKTANVAEKSKNHIRWSQVKEEITYFNKVEKRSIECAAYLAPKLIEKRRQLGLTQGYISEKTGILQPALSRIERGEVIPEIGTIQLIADVLGLKLDLVENNESK
jgi:Predicted transcriptional regulator with C-terminal CBS domains